MLDKNIRIIFTPASSKQVPTFYVPPRSRSPARPVLSLKRRKTDSGYVPPTPYETFLNKALGTNISNPLMDYSGFWTIDRLLTASISIGCRYERTPTNSERFVVCHVADATHHVYSRSILSSTKISKACKIIGGLSRLTHGLMLSNDVTSMQQCILTCETTNRYISLASAALLLPKDKWEQFCLTKDSYIIFNESV